MANDIFRRPLREREERWYGDLSPPKQATSSSNREYLQKLALAHELAIDRMIAEHESEMDRIVAESRARIERLYDDPPGSEQS
jgi:hypothetical protein